MRPHRRKPTRLPLGFSRQEHWSGCHFLLQFLKVKSESEVAQSCPTLSNPMDCSLLGSSIHGIFQAKVLEWGAIAFSATSLLEKCKSKLHWGTTHTGQNGHDLKKVYKITSAAEGVEKREPSNTVGGNINWCSHYGKQYGGLSKRLKLELPYYSAIPLLGMYPDKTIIQRNMYSYVHSSTIHNNQDVKTT